MNKQQRDDLKARWLGLEVRVRAESALWKRFSTRTGIVREVNWNGLCLVEWQGIQDDGWYDIPPQELVPVQKAAKSEASVGEVE